MIDATLRTMLIFGALPAIAVLAGVSALFRVLAPGLVSGVRKFAAGALFAVIAVELLPDLISTHEVAAMLALASGIVVMIAVIWLTGGLSRPTDEAARPRAVVAKAMIYLSLSGLLIGAGYVAGVREGVLLTSALTVEALHLGLVTATDLNVAGMRRGRVVMILAGLAILIGCSTAAGAALWWGRTGIDFDVLFAFGLGALLVHAMESFVELRGEHSPILDLLLFFLGTVLFLALGGWLGRRHSDHPGRRATTQVMIRNTYVRLKWDNDVHPHPLRATVRVAGARHEDVLARRAGRCHPQLQNRAHDRADGKPRLRWTGDPSLKRG